MSPVKWPIELIPTRSLFILAYLKPEPTLPKSFEWHLMLPEIAVYLSVEKPASPLTGSYLLKLFYEINIKWLLYNLET